MFQNAVLYINGKTTPAVVVRVNGKTTPSLQRLRWHDEILSFFVRRFPVHFVQPGIGYDVPHVLPFSIILLPIAYYSSIAAAYFCVEHNFPVGDVMYGAEEFEGASTFLTRVIVTWNRAQGA